MGARRRAPSPDGDDAYVGEDYDGDLVTPKGTSGSAQEAGALRDEVKAMLGTLGLATSAPGGAADGFDDRDFRPQPKAKAKCV